MKSKEEVIKETLEKVNYLKPKGIKKMSKQIEFKTSKGEFVIANCNDEFLKNYDKFIKDKVKVGCVSELTEQQASEVVDSDIFTGNEFRYYLNEDYIAKTALNSFNSLLESLGISNWNKSTTYLFKRV